MLIREGFRTMPGTISLKLSCMEKKNIVIEKKFYLILVVAYVEIQKSFPTTNFVVPAR